MAQDSQSPIDRDCLIAATLAAGGTNTHVPPDQMVQRFEIILGRIRKAGGTAKLWDVAGDPQKYQVL